MPMCFAGGPFRFECTFTPEDGPTIVFDHARSVATARGPFGSVVAIDGLASLGGPLADRVGLRGSFSAAITQQGETDRHEGVGEVLAIARMTTIAGATRVLVVLGLKSEATEGIAAALVAAWMAETSLPSLKDAELTIRPRHCGFDREEIARTARRLQDEAAARA